MKQKTLAWLSVAGFVGLLIMAGLLFSPVTSSEHRRFVNIVKAIENDKQLLEIAAKRNLETQVIQGYGDRFKILIEVKVQAEQVPDADYITRIEEIASSFRYWQSITITIKSNQSETAWNPIVIKI